MARGRPKRAWVKLDCYGILHGSINWELTLEEQAVWIKSFAYSAVCGGKPGIIQDNDTHPLPHWYIANELHCPLEVFESMLKKCIAQDRLRENEHGIEVINFDEYQFTEYDRQRPYREAKKHEGSSPDTDPKLEEYSKAFTAASAKLRKKLRREPTMAEIRELQVDVRRRVYGEEG